MRQTEIQDLITQNRRLIALTTALLERYARLGEELDFVRLNLVEMRELLADYFTESGRNADRVSEHLARLEHLAILEKTHTNPRETIQIKSDIAVDLRRDKLRSELAQQTKNLAHAQERAAKYGFDIPTRLQNEIDTYDERIQFLRNELKTPLDENQKNSIP